MKYISINSSTCEQGKKEIKNTKILFNNKLNFIINKCLSKSTKKLIIKKIIILLFLIILKNLFFFFNKNQIKSNLLNKTYSNFVNPNKYLLSNYFKNINEQNEIYFNITSIYFSFDTNKNVIKTEFKIDFYEQNNDLIPPSDLTLFYKFHILCIMKDINHNIMITSFANIVRNSHFVCIEFFDINEKIQFGIEIYQDDKLIKKKNFYFFLFNKHYCKNFINKYDKRFSCLNVNKEYMILNRNIIEENNSSKFKLKELYILKPECSTKQNTNLLDNEWHFINLYNHYFCFCKGLFCKYEAIPQKCKYFFYLSIIDNNKDLYNKTDYLFGDFIYKEYSLDDAYPIFEEMINQNFSAHYLTQNADAYAKYCKLKSKCLTILPVFERKEIIDGNFLEKYLTLILKLKAVISGAEFFYINNLFYNIDYITFISLGHGVSYFKHFLYSNNSYYGNRRYNKILIPPSKKFISIAKNYGWTKENIIKINLPRWDKYNHLDGKNKNKNYIMFTWREIVKNKTISNDYFKNILNLINNELLIKATQRNNISLYFALHHRQYEFKSKLLDNKHIKLISEYQISDLLSKTNLLVSDFSSIIFDIIYRNKPFIIFIPDSNYSDIKDKYSYNYYKLIKDIKEGIIPFKNKYFNVKEAVNKIIYYINNDFKLEKYLQKFYSNFGFRKKNSTQKFINYLKNLK